MSKRKNKEIAVNILAGPNDSEDTTELLVQLQDKTIGAVRDAENGYVAEYIMDGSKTKLPSIDEAVEYIVKQYNLHEL